MRMKILRRIDGSNERQFCSNVAIGANMTRHIVSIFMSIFLLLYGRRFELVQSVVNHFATLRTIFFFFKANFSQILMKLLFSHAARAHAF